MMSEERVLCLFSFYFFPEIWHKQQSTIDEYLLLSIRKRSPCGLSANRGSLLGVTTVGRLAKRWWETWSFGGCGWDEKGRGVCWSKPSVAGLYPSSGSALWPGAQRPGRWSTGNDDPHSYLDWIWGFLLGFMTSHCQARLTTYGMGHCPPFVGERHRSMTWSHLLAHRGRLCVGPFFKSEVHVV